MSTVKTQQKKDSIKIAGNYSFAGMPIINKIIFTPDTISFYLSDGRILAIPLAWIPKLEDATNDTREKYIIRGHFVFWDSIDEIIGVKNLLEGSIVPK